MVSSHDGEKLARDNGLIFVETSALDGDNVQKTFETVAQKVLIKVTNGIIDPKIEVC